MKILCISYEYPPIGGGGAPVCERLCRAFVQSGHQVDVLTSRVSGLGEHETRDGVQIFRSACLRRHRHYTTAFELLTTLLPAYRTGYRLAEKNDYDLIHCHFIVPSGIVAAALSRRFRVPYVLTAHGSDMPGYNPDRFKLLHKIIYPLWRRIVTGASAVTTPSRFLCQLLQSHIDVPVTIIPNSFAAPPPSSVPRRDRILAVSRLFKRKGMQFLIEAFRRLDCDWELIIVGDGPYLDSLRALSADLDTKVEFKGFVTGKPLQDLYASAKIFVLPSVKENFPVVLLEAMGAGNAVITTRGSGCEEVIGSAGVLVERADPGALADAMQRLIRNEEMRIHYSRSAIERAYGFGEQTIAQRFESLFDDCRLGTDPRPRADS